MVHGKLSNSKFVVLIALLCVTIGTMAQALDETEKEYLVYMLEDEDEIKEFECTVMDCQGPVDLGLPSGLKWATCNIGATSPEDYGTYFAWGDTVGYMGADSHDFAQNNYVFYKNGRWTKYNQDDKLKQLELIDDAAHASWQENWRMPTATEWNELITYCSVNRMVSRGVEGLLITGRNSNSIFLPLAGYRQGWEWTLTGIFEQLIGQILPMGSYWSSSLSTKSTQDAQYLYYLGIPRFLFWGPICEVREESRWLGRPVRAVCKECE